MRRTGLAATSSVTATALACWPGTGLKRSVREEELTVLVLVTQI